MQIVIPQQSVGWHLPAEKCECQAAQSAHMWLKEHKDEFAVLPCPLNPEGLKPIVNIWVHDDRIVRAMDLQPCNLQQLAMQLESPRPWLPVTTTSRNGV